MARMDTEQFSLGATVAFVTVDWAWSIFDPKARVSSLLVVVIA